MLKLINENKDFKQYEDQEKGYSVEIEFKAGEINIINGIVYADYPIEFLKRKDGVFKIIQYSNTSKLLSVWQTEKLIESYNKALVCIEKLKKELDIK